MGRSLPLGIMVIILTMVVVLEVASTSVVEHLVVVELFRPMVVMPLVGIQVAAVVEESPSCTLQNHTRVL